MKKEYYFVEVDLTNMTIVDRGHNDKSDTYWKYK